MNIVKYSPEAPVAQTKSIDEKIADETKVNAELKAAFMRAQEAAKPYEQAKMETGTRWHNSNMRLDMLQAMKREMAQ